MSLFVVFQISVNIVKKCIGMYKAFQNIDKNLNSFDCANNLIRLEHTST